MKFKAGNTITNKDGDKIEIIDLDTTNKEYAVLNCLGRRIWLEAKDIDNNYRLSTPIYIQPPFSF